MEESFILVLPVSYDEIINFNLSYKKVINILSENPNNIYTDDEIIKYDGITETIPHSKKEFLIYNKKSDNNIEKKIKIFKIDTLPTEIHKGNIEQIKTMKTNIACWWCCYQFETYPVCAPQRYNMKTDIFKVKGCFCSFNCALSYLCENKKNTDLSLLSFLHKRITGTVSRIVKAPPKEILEKFGGPISIEDYRKSFVKIHSFNLIVFPMISDPRYLELEDFSPDKKEVIKNKTINTASIETRAIISTNRMLKHKVETTNSLTKVLNFIKK